MAALDDRVAMLYQTPLSEFTAARNQLAASLSGDARARVRRLAKPTLVPWAINQVYWHARAVFDRARAAGEALRSAQIAALRGRHADVRAATERHRTAIGDAVREAMRLAGAQGSHPSADALTRMWEAVSLAVDLPEPPGRFTTVLQPLGFAALAGIAPAAGAERTRPARMTSERTQPRENRLVAREGAARRVREERVRAQAEAAKQRADAARARHQAVAARRAIAATEHRARKAAAALAHAARIVLKRHEAVTAAEREETSAREAHARAAAEASAAQAELDRLRPR